MRFFKSESGDMYEIPDENYEEDVKNYREAVKRDDESTMLYYEEGRSGWILIDE